MGTEGFTRHPDHLRVYLTIYAVFFTLGVRESVEAAWTDKNCQTWLAAVSLALIGLRLLFSPEALSHFLITYRRRFGPLPGWFVWFYPFLLAQAVCVFLACHALHEPTCGMHALTKTVVGWALGALAINVVWLACMFGIEKCSKLTGKNKSGSCDTAEESQIPSEHCIWIVNNLVSAGVAAVILFCVACYAEITALMVLLAGSLIDLHLTGHWYLPRFKELDSSAPKETESPTSDIRHTP
jgi:hypothetical protein